MASFVWRDGKCRAEVVRLGIRKSKTFPTKRAAELWAAEIEADILSGRRKASDGKMTVAEALQRFGVEKSPERRGERWEQIRLKKFERELPFASEQIGDVTPDDLAAWVRTRLKRDKLKPDSVRREFGLLSSVFEVARKEWRALRENPCRDVALPDKGKPRSRRISDEEIAAICTALGYRDDWPVTTRSQEVAIAFLVAIETAMRAGEILSLTRDQVDFEARVATLLRTKNGDDRLVPLSMRAVALLSKLPGAPRLFNVRSGTLDALFRRARDVAKVEGLHFHDTRREATSRLATRFDVLDLAKITGHRDVSLLLRVYYKPSVARLVERIG